jgi:hypothetical protein
MGEACAIHDGDEKCVQNITQKISEKEPTWETYF